MDRRRPLRGRISAKQKGAKDLQPNTGIKQNQRKLPSHKLHSLSCNVLSIVLAVSRCWGRRGCGESTSTLHFPILLNWRGGKLLGNREVVAQGACCLEKVSISPPRLPPAPPNLSKNSGQQVHSWPLPALKHGYFWGGSVTRVRSIRSGKAERTARNGEGQGMPGSREHQRKAVTCCT